MRRRNWLAAFLLDQDNQAALCRLTTLLTYRDYAIPIDRLEHDGDVVFAQFSPDTTRVVTASWDHTARIWDILPNGKSTPGWLPRLAEAIADEHVTEQG